MNPLGSKKNWNRRWTQTHADKRENYLRPSAFICGLKTQILPGKKIFYILVIALAFLLLPFNFPAGATTEAKHYTDLQFAPLPEVKLPNYERYVLDNGIVVYLMEDHDLPLVSGTVVVGTGGRLEPADKVGLAGLVGMVMRNGGTVQHSPDELNEMLEQRAAEVETSIGETFGNASFAALSEDLSTVFGLFAEVIRTPVFAQDHLDLAKMQQRGGIARRNDDPNDIAGREFLKLIYGKESPYGRTVEYETLDQISREDLVKFYEQYFYPNQMILGILGDFDTEKMRSLVQSQFGDWKPNLELVKPQLPKVAQAQVGGVFFVNQPQLTQSSILIGHLGGQFNSPDYPALDVLNGVLNGLGGRLFNEVRSRQGLAYSVYGYWSPNYDYPGMFIAGGQTRSETTVQFVQAIRDQIKRLQTQLLTPKELAVAKESTLNSFVFNFANPSQTLSRLIGAEYYDYPADFIFRYQQAVTAITAADIQRVALRYLKPENLVTLVVGNQSAISPPLTQLATQVTVIDVHVPDPRLQARN